MTAFRIKLDENLGQSHAALLRDAGYDAEVVGQFNWPPGWHALARAWNLANHQPRPSMTQGVPPKLD